MYVVSNSVQKNPLQSILYLNIKTHRFSPFLKHIFNIWYVRGFSNVLFWIHCVDKKCTVPKYVVNSVQKNLMKSIFYMGEHNLTDAFEIGMYFTCDNLTDTKMAGLLDFCPKWRRKKLFYFTLPLGIIHLWNQILR